MSLDNLRHAQYGDDGMQIDDPQSVLRVSQAILPQATLHLRASGAGILDLSRNAVAVTVGAGVITQPA